MRLFGWFRKPTYAIYCDRSTDGWYTARIVAQPNFFDSASVYTHFTMPPKPRWEKPNNARLHAVKELKDMGVSDAHRADCFFEDVDRSIKRLPLEAMT